MQLLPGTPRRAGRDNPKTRGHLWEGFHQTFSGFPADVPDASDAGKAGRQENAAEGTLKYAILGLLNCTYDLVIR